ncbi:hypothetical protein CMI48_05065 [Candidatus Pacearchaeota archaeon]|jgi:hypothetical protein|nr:hypothetical protein [Candidatus Pacearchaeota archaeon]MAE50131.1 hypothetical protein [Candidatus Pacearchaeota archaeon]MAE50165.1 hypothetical protein [Candidatus Pacearchaeota archaeon]|tara:strand:- start:62 stop:316 length:255 start_codon:yes stop_codon:yes gene_type:complete
MIRALSPTKKSILYKIAEFKIKYTKRHGKHPNVMYLDPDEREDLRKACGIKEWKWPVVISGMQLRKHEEYTNIGGFMVRKMDSQ